MNPTIWDGHEHSAADTCRHHGWTVGTQLEGDEGYGPTVIELTAIGERYILAKTIEDRRDGRPRGENLWTLAAREWREVYR